MFLSYFELKIYELRNRKIFFISTGDIIVKLEKREKTQKVKKWSKDIGFDLVGICSAEPFNKAYQYIKNRNLSSFVDDNKELLTTPQIHLKTAKSIISLGISYASKRNTKDNQFIALYACGMDYHRFMKEKMEELIDRINTLPEDIETIAYSDTGALLDREVAYRAGLGWIGKNNNLINPDYGSYLFLGEIITNLELEYDKPIESRCGSCQLCLENCPAAALKPYDLNHEKCLSYITQKRGILTEEERSTIGNRLWGCDTCLETCPYNNSIPMGLHDEFRPVLKGNIKEILDYTKDNFPEEWKNSALSWRGLRILKRNTIINMGNIKDEEYLPLLKKELENPSPVIRAYVIWALGEFQNNKIIDVIKQQKSKEKDQVVLKEIKKILSRLEN